MNGKLLFLKNILSQDLEGNSRKDIITNEKDPKGTFDDCRFPLLGSMKAIPPPPQSLKEPPKGGFLGLGSCEQRMDINEQSPKDFFEAIQ